jgi:hypothetical protein
LIAAHDLLARAFDLLLGPLDRWNPVAGLWAASVVAGVALLFIFRWTSNPEAIRAARRRAQAELLAVRLYREEPRVVLRAQARFLAAIARYLGQMLVPFAALALPLSLFAAHLDARYGSRALAVGERAVVEVLGTATATDAASLEPSEGLAVEAGPVRIPARGEASWRILAKASGPQSVTLVVGERRIDKEVSVSTTARGAAPRRMCAGLVGFFLAPAEPAIDESCAVRRIEVRYPSLEVDFFRWKTSWIVVFLAVSSTVALVLRRRAGVEF